MSTFFVNFTASLAVLCASTAAFAHAQLQKATPAVGGAVASASEIRLKFSEGVEPPFSGLALTASDGESVPLGHAKVVPGDPSVLVVPLPNRWRRASTQSTGMQSRSTPIALNGASASP